MAVLGQVPAAVLVAGLQETVPVPLAAEPVGGTSWSPVKTKVKLFAIVVSSRAGFRGPLAPSRFQPRHHAIFDPAVSSFAFFI
jgi:hypothetical protein